VARDLAGEIPDGVGRMAHFAIVALFAATITLQLRRSTEK